MSVFDDPKTLIFDVETFSVEEMFTMPPEEFVRLIGYKWVNDENVTLTTYLEELREQIRGARWIVGHNIHSFDLPVVFGVQSDEPLELAMEGRVYDTWTHGALVFPAPYQYTNRHGKKALAATPKQMKTWHSLDEQAYQLGVTGKTHDLKALALEFGKIALPDAPRKEQVNAGFGLIPVTDNRYRDYLVGDVHASEAVGRGLLSKGLLDAYALREQEIEARKTVIRANGLRVDIEAATKRRDELEARKTIILGQLQEKYGLPTEGKAPWSTTKGKEAIFAALADHGITSKTVEDWPKTDTGNLSLGGDALISITEGTTAEDLGKALAEVKGQRPLSQQALDHVYPDGFVHPEVTMLQRSGRWSTVEPGLTTWTNNGPGAIEKDYFIADNDDELLVEFDYSNADSRIVAALSGDTDYAIRFEPGADGHMINALAAWGEETVSKDPKGYRQKAKVLGHAWNYGSGPRGLHNNTGLPLEDTKSFCDGMNSTYAALVSWQDRARSEAHQTGHVVNSWGRRMRVDKGREYTQAPALLGQSGTREIVCDALLRMPISVLRRVKCQVHDALLMSIPKKFVEEGREYVIKLMSTEFKPQHGGQLLDFPVSSGPAARTWHGAIH